MTLAAFAVVRHRWKPASLIYRDYDAYQPLMEHLPRSTFEDRMDLIRDMVRKKFPSHWLDTQLFFLAIILVMAAAAFAIVAHAHELAMWYPLLILIVPAMIAYWTTRRRRFHTFRLAAFHHSLQTLLKDLTVIDRSHQIKWSYRRVREFDTGESLKLQKPLNKYRIVLIVEVSRMDPESTAHEPLPSYHAVAQDVVLQVGPPPTYPPPSYQPDHRV